MIGIVLFVLLLVSPSLVIAQVVAIRPGFAQLKWDDNSNDEDKFEIERCAGRTCTNFAKRDEVAANVTGYTDKGLQSDTFYRWRVRAVKGQVLSDYSNVAEGITSGVYIVGSVTALPPSRRSGDTSRDRLLPSPSTATTACLRS